MGGKGQHTLVRRIDQQIIDNHSDLCSPFGRPQQAFCSQNTDIVGAPDEVLHFNARGGMVCEPGTGEQRIYSSFKDKGTAFAGVLPAEIIGYLRKLYCGGLT